MANPLAVFTDLMTDGTGPAYVNDPSKLINDGALRNFNLLDRLTTDRSKESVQGGSSIKATLILDDPLTASSYAAGDVATLTNPQVLITEQVNWRFVRVPIVWNEKEIILNGGDSNTTGKARFQQFANLKRAKMQAAYTSLYNKLERYLVAAYSNSLMDNGNDPFSIFYSITSDGLAPTNGSNTTVYGINPTTKTKWRNQTGTYTYATPFDQSNGIIPAFDAMSQLVQFKAPSKDGEYFTNSDLKRQVILTNREGQRLYNQCLRAANNITRNGANDPSYEAVYNGVQVSAVEAFDDQSTFTSGQPGYLWTNFNNFKLVFHADKFMMKSEVFAWGNQPDTKAMWIDVWANLFNDRRQVHGYVSAA